VRDIISRVYKRTYALLEEHRQGLEEVANLLLEKEVLQQADLEKLLGARPFPIKKMETTNSATVETLDEKPSTEATASQNSTSSSENTPDKPAQ